MPLGRAHLARFSDGEIWFQIQDNVRGADVFVVQPTCPPVNENLMELLVMLDAFKRSSASRITAVIPYYGYARQDRKDKPRVPISAKLVADLLSTAGTDRVLTMDLHAPADPGLLRRARRPPVRGARDHRLRREAEAARSSPSSRPTRAAWSARAPTPSGWTRRSPSWTSAASQPNVAEVHHVIGDVEGRTALIVDDIVDTGGHAGQGRRGPQGRGRARGAGLRRRTPCCPGTAVEKIEAEPALAG